MKDIYNKKRIKELPRVSRYKDKNSLLKAIGAPTSKYENVTESLFYTACDLTSQCIGQIVEDRTNNTYVLIKYDEQYPWLGYNIQEESYELLIYFIEYLIVKFFEKIFEECGAEDISLTVHQDFFTKDNLYSDEFEKELKTIFGANFKELKKVYDNLPVCSLEFVNFDTDYLFDDYVSTALHNMAHEHEIEFNSVKELESEPRRILNNEEHMDYCHFYHDIEDAYHYKNGKRCYSGLDIIISGFDNYEKFVKEVREKTIEKYGYPIVNCYDFASCKKLIGYAKERIISDAKLL